MDILFFGGICQERRYCRWEKACLITVKIIGDSAAYLLAKSQNRYSHGTGALAFSAAGASAGKMDSVYGLKKQFVPGA